MEQEKAIEMLKDIWEKISKEEEPPIKQVQWEEDGEIYTTWKFNVPATGSTRAVVGYTNDAGVKAIYDAMIKEIQKQEKDQQNGTNYRNTENNSSTKEEVE